MRTQLVRSAVLEIYEQVRREGARADQALQRVLRREKQLRSVERRSVSDAVYRLLAAALNQRAPLTVRANLLKNSREELIATLRAEGSRVEPTKVSPWGVTFTGRTNVFALRAFKAGLFEVQDEGSQLIALACQVRPGQLVVDACAGAGGKSLAPASEMRNKGRLIAAHRDHRRP